MQCPYCGRDIPEDARWCPYCGTGQTPPEAQQAPVPPADAVQDDPAPKGGRQDEDVPSEDRSGENAATGWQDAPAPADDWDDEAEPPADDWQDDPPVPGWEDDTPYEPAPDEDAPRSKALLIAIFAALGVALIVLLIALNVKPKPKDPAAAVPPAVTATAQLSAAPTPTPTPTPTTPSPTPTPSTGSYILSDSATRRLTQADVANLTWEQCCLARNEIFARHGRIFQTPQIAAYFEAQSWYHGTVPGASFDNNSLSPTERANADFLANYETATWGHSYY